MSLVARFFSHGGTLAVAVTCVPLALRSIDAPAAVLGGVILFITEEYLVHRFLLHATPSRFAALAHLQRNLHLGHHEHPHDIRRVFIPLPAVALLAVLHAWLYQAAGLTLPATLLGSLLGYLYYEWVHFIAHVPVRPSTRWGRYIKRCHLRHHFKDDHACFGVTSPLFDILLGTRGATSTRGDTAASGTR